MKQLCIAISLTFTHFNFVAVYSKSLRYGTTAMNYGDSSAFTVGSKSTQPSAGGYLMRSLAVWKRALSPQEVNRIYLAGKENICEMQLLEQQCMPYRSLQCNYFKFAA